MNELEIQYRGYAIRFSENAETWGCWALNVEGEKMATVKAKIDKIIVAARKLSEPAAALYMEHSGIVTPVRIVAFAEPRKKGADPTDVWVMIPEQERYFDHETRTNAYRTVEGRKKKPLDKLYADTPENREAVREMERIAAEIKQLHAKRDAVKATLTTIGTVFSIPAAEDTNEPA